MRRLTSVSLTLAGAIAAVLVGSCSDNPVEPRSPAAPAHMPVSLATASTASGATFTTDKDDYMPGDTLKLAGTGWQPGDSLDIHLDEDPQNHPPLDWMVGVDESGQFRDSSYVVQQSDLGVTFALTATSRATGETATATFTDANRSVSVAAVVGSVAPGGSASYQVTASFGGNATNCTTALTITGLPTGAAGSFNPSSLTGNSNDTPKNSDLTITTTPSGGSATPPGTYAFTVHASKGTGCDGAADVTGGGTLIVFGPATHIDFGKQPTATAATATINASTTPPFVIVRVLDAGNRVVANSSASIGLAIGTNPGSGSLSGTTPKSAVNGVATFDDLSIDKIGTGYTLVASSTGFSNVTSDFFNITLGPAAQVVFSTQPSGATANTAFTTQPVVDVQDAGGNRITTGVGSGTTITLTIVSGTGTAGAILACNPATNALTATNGRATFADCKIDQAGTGYKLRATTGNLGGGIGVLSGDSDPFNVTGSNQKPIADAGTYTDKNEGDEITLDGSASYDPDAGDAIVSYTWRIVSFTTPVNGNGGQCSFKNGTNTGVSPIVTCNDNGTLVVGLTVNDGELDSDEAQATINVLNVAPTISSLKTPLDGTLPTSVIVGATVDIKVSFTDPGSNDTHTAEIDCGSGTYSDVNSGNDITSPFQTSCTFNSVGSKTVRVKVTDDDDDYDVKTYTVSVQYDFSGLFAPVDRPTTLNASKAGQGVPLKWYLKDFFGNPVTTLTAVVVNVKNQTCSLGDTTDQLEEIATGQSGLQNFLDGNYQFNWATPKSYARSCKTIGLDLGEGFVRTNLAWFTFKN